MKLMNVVWYLSMNVARHFNPKDSRSPTFWQYFRGTPVEELLGGRGNGIYEVEFGSEEGRHRTIHLRRRASGFDPELETVVFVAAGKETWEDPGDPDLAYFGANDEKGNPRHCGSAVTLPPGVRPAKLVKDQPFTNFDGYRAIGMWRERGSRHYHIVVVPEDTRLEKPTWPYSEPVKGEEEFDDTEADTVTDDVIDGAPDDAAEVEIPDGPVRPNSVPYRSGDGRD